MTNLHWLKWAIARHFRQRGLKVRLFPVKVGNAAIDGEVVGRGWRIAIELKTPGDDVVRGLGQLVEALAHGYHSAALVTTMRSARRIKPQVFDAFNIVLLGVDSRGQVTQVFPTYASSHVMSPFNRSKSCSDS